MKNLNQLENRLSKFSLKNEELTSLKGGGKKGGAGTTGEGGGLLPPMQANVTQLSFSFSFNS